MSKEHRDQEIALQGSLKAATRIERKGEPKIGVEEFMALVKRFGFSSSAAAGIRAIAAREDLGEGPFLANYYSGLRESSVQAFERTARETFGSAYAIGTSSGTGALHAAFVGVGVGPGTEVICPAIGFSATANAVDLAGGKPVICDVDESLHLDPDKIEALVTPRTVALAPTHVMGGVCRMDAIMRVARRHRLRVVEDCAQSCGGQFRGRYVGTIGDVGTFSISCYKIIGAGEGGLLLAKRKRDWERASQVVESGGLWRPNRFGPPRYEGELFTGTNYRMSELEATLDVVQLKKMPRTVQRFRKVKQAVLRRLRSFREITPQLIHDPAGEVGYTLRFYPETHALGKRIVEDLTAVGIKAVTRGPKASPDWHCYWHIHHLARKHGFGRGDCPVADDLFDRMVSIALNQWYSAEDCNALADRINTVLSAHCSPDSGSRGWV